MAPAKTRSRDRSSLTKYRVELPILLDDLNLSVYAFRLYVHFKRVAERSEEGSCWESARTLASACNMSSGQVSKAKDELEQQGLITRHIKMMRGGIGDDITIVDIWPQNFARYAPESDPRKESDHSTITSEQKVITPRSLCESDHSTITFDESDQEVIASASKRSYSDPIDHDQYHIESDSDSMESVPPPPPPPPTRTETKNGGGGGGRTLAFLIDQGIGSAKDFAHLPYDQTVLDYQNRRASGQGNGAIVLAWRSNPPTETYHYEQPALSRSGNAAAERKPSERLGERPTLPPGLKIARRHTAE